jgi:imidazolonepropionase
MAVSDRGIEALARARVTAVLLPGTSFFLAKRTYAPARRLIAAGVPVALGTDCNPGSSYTESLPTIAQLAVFELGLSIEEALVAMTLNAAATLEMAAEIGTLEPGKRADLVVLDAPNLLHLAYHYGVNPVRSVVREGVEVYRAGNLLRTPSASSSRPNHGETR